MMMIRVGFLAGKFYAGFVAITSIMDFGLRKKGEGKSERESVCEPFPRQFVE